MMMDLLRNGWPKNALQLPKNRRSKAGASWILSACSGEIELFLNQFRNMRRYLMRAVFLVRSQGVSAKPEMINHGVTGPNVQPRC